MHPDDAVRDMKAQRPDVNPAGYQEAQAWRGGQGPRLRVQAAAEGMGQGLFVDASTTDAPWEL